MKLIDKDKIAAEIERRIKYDEMVMDHNTQITELLSRELNTLYELSSFIKSLEVKEGVNLNNEYTEEVYSHLDSIKDTADRMTSGNFMHNKAAIKFSANTIAKVLELMGLKTQKGE